MDYKFLTVPTQTKQDDKRPHDDRISEELNKLAKEGWRVSHYQYADGPCGDHYFVLEKRNVNPT